MSERDDITAGDDPADPTERRDWDLPPDAVDATDESGDEPEPPAGEAVSEPPEESERRDWDVP